MKNNNQPGKPEDTLRDKNDVLSNLLVNLQEGILLEDANRQIVLTNQLFCDMFGIEAPPGLLIGADCSNSAEQSKMFFKDPETFIAKINLTLATRTPVFNEPLELVDGRHFERDYIPTYLDNQYNGHLWKYRDVTERKKVEVEISNLNAYLEIKISERTSQLREANEMLQNEIEERKQVEVALKKAKSEAENANLAKSEFLSRMSHELRTPMNSILGFAQLLEMSELNVGHKKGINHILSSGKHLLKLINEVLDISTIEAGRLTIMAEPIKVAAVISEMTDIVQLPAHKRHLTIIMDDSPANQLFVHTDRQRLKQVLLNLLNNAIKYNRPGGSVTIKTEFQQKGVNDICSVRISIIDTGFGIHTEDLEKLFLPFERIGAEKSETEGTGLGLTVVKKLMDAMGGRMGVESTPGKGSTFWIELPQADCQKTGTSLPDAEPGPESASIEKTGTILYIEDNIPNAELVEGIIGSHRPAIRIITAMYGRLAVKFALDYQPDLILLDLDLPDMPGIEVLAGLQANAITKYIPVVILSADATSQQIEKLMNSGARDYLTKPLDIHMFLHVVDEWMTEKKRLI